MFHRLTRIVTEVTHFGWLMVFRWSLVALSARPHDQQQTSTQSDQIVMTDTSTSSSSGGGGRGHGAAHVSQKALDMLHGGNKRRGHKVLDVLGTTQVSCYTPTQTDPSYHSLSTFLYDMHWMSR
jgi:hypothetical protein